MRVDFNVPIKEGTVKDPTRVRTTIPTIKQVLENSPKNIVLMSHLGRPNGQRNDKHSMKPVVPVLEDLLGKKVNFLNDCVGDDIVATCNSGSQGQVYLLENLRFHAEEEGSRKDAHGKKVCSC